MVGTDTYAFGLILYDMLLGRRRSEQAASAMDELTGRMKAAPPSMRSVDPDIPQHLDEIVGRCVDPDSDVRFQTANPELAQRPFGPPHRLVQRRPPRGELDKERRERLLHLLPSFSQVLLTSATSVELPQVEYTIHEIRQGEVVS